MLTWTEEIGYVVSEVKENALANVVLAFAIAILEKEKLLFPIVMNLLSAILSIGINATLAPPDEFNVATFAIAPGASAIIVWSRICWY